MAIGPAAKSLVAISTNVAGTVLIITLEVACCIWLKTTAGVRRDVKMCQCWMALFWPTICNCERTTKYVIKYYSSWPVVDLWSLQISRLFTHISLRVCIFFSPGRLTPLHQKAQPAGHSDLHWPYSVRCVKCRQTVHSFWQEMQAPLCCESFKTSSDIHPYRVMHRLRRLMFLKPSQIWMGPWSKATTYTLSKEKGHTAMTCDTSPLHCCTRSSSPGTLGMCHQPHHVTNSEPKGSKDLRAWW